MRPHLLALAVALLVTVLWSTSWVLIKLGLEQLALPPLSFAGLRYTLAALVLLPLAVPALRRARPWTRGGTLATRVAVLGLLLYAVAQGAQFAALVHLPAVAVGLILSTTPVLVALLTLRGAERLTAVQAAGIGGLVAGAALYFGPFALETAALLGLVAAVAGVAANAVAAVLGRGLARDSLSDIGGVLPLTAVSMAIGAFLLLAVGLAVEGPPAMSLEAWLIVVWLAVVNTAVAFTLWNHTLRTLTAVESSVINNLMLVQIAVLAWLFLGERLTVIQLVGLGVALAGILAVQLAPLRAHRSRVARVA